GLDSRLRGNDEFQDYGVVGAQLNRHSHESGNLESRGFQSFPIDSRRVGGLDSRLRGNDEFQDCGIVGNDGFQDYGVVGNDGLGISTPAPRL
ncbi:TPA: hypothetical protein ACFM8C_002139, partial [Neisseria meningitidis]